MTEEKYRSAELTEFVNNTKEKGPVNNIAIIKEIYETTKGVVNIAGENSVCIKNLPS